MQKRRMRAAANVGQGIQPGLELAVERREAVVIVAGMSRIDMDDEEPLAIETELLRAKVG